MKDVRSQHEHNRQWQGYVRFPGVRDHGMYDNLITRQPGRPRAFFPQGKYAATTEEGGRQKMHGESDGLVVPMKAGNAAGGKETTYGSAA